MFQKFRFVITINERVIRRDYGSFNVLELSS